MSKASNEIFIGKKPLMTYVTATLVQLASEDKVFVKARGNSIVTAVDVAQIIEKRMGNIGYRVGGVRLGSETLQSMDGRPRNVSTIEIEILKGGQGSPDSSNSETKADSNDQGKKKAKKKE